MKHFYENWPFTLKCPGTFFAECRKFHVGLLCMKGRVTEIISIKYCLPLYMMNIHAVTDENTLIPWSRVIINNNTSNRTYRHVLQESGLWLSCPSRGCARGGNRPPTPPLHFQKRKKEQVKEKIEKNEGKMSKSRNYNKWPQYSLQRGQNWWTPLTPIFLKFAPLQMRQSTLTRRLSPNENTLAPPLCPSVLTGVSNLGLLHYKPFFFL